MSSNEDIDLTPDFIKERAKTVVENILPPNSKERYIKAYDEFMKWRSEKKVKSLSESVFISYFDELSKRLQPSSLWCFYSMLKSTMMTKHDVNLKDFSKLTAFLKRQSDGFKSKKSKVFTAEEVQKFLNEAPDEIYLAIKVPTYLLALFNKLSKYFTKILCEFGAFNTTYVFFTGCSNIWDIGSLQNRGIDKLDNRKCRKT